MRSSPVPSESPRVPGESSGRAGCDEASSGLSRTPGIDRLRQRRDFHLTYRGGRRVVGELVVVYVRSTGTAARRAGIPVGRRFGGAVRRNRLRRRLREAVRRVEDLVPSGTDLIVVPRGPAAEAPFGVLVDAVGAALRKGLREQAEGL
ncbi:MAG: ribonuclease P protein component [Armatimonadetes bacterium]|nr:ribonuclease P protein component [Armatimonadota bacterium]